jgi:hypothetical protein
MQRQRSERSPGACLRNLKIIASMLQGNTMRFAECGMWVECGKLTLFSTSAPERLRLDVPLVIRAGEAQLTLRWTSWPGGMWRNIHFMI